MYALDEMGGGASLSDDVKSRLAECVFCHPCAYVLFAYLESEPVGLITCLLSLSTFAAKPILNVHDIAVRPEVRGQGIGRALLAAAESLALELGCCRMSLEVLEHNPARRLYAAAGFLGCEEPATRPRTYFCTKELDGLRNSSEGPRRP